MSEYLQCICWVCPMVSRKFNERELPACEKDTELTVLFCRQFSGNCFNQGNKRQRYGAYFSLLDISHKNMFLLIKRGSQVVKKSKLLIVNLNSQYTVPVSA